MELRPLVMLVLVTTLAHLDEVDGKSKPAGRGRGSMWWYVFRKRLSKRIYLLRVIMNTFIILFVNYITLLMYVCTLYVRYSTTVNH